MKIALYEWILIAAFLVSLYKYIRSIRQLPYYTLFLANAVLFELFITYYWRSFKDVNPDFFSTNYLPYNVFGLMCAFYYIYIYLPFLKDKFRKILLWILGAWLLYCMYDLATAGWLKVNYVCYIPLMVIAISLIFNYIYRLAFVEEYQPIMYNPRIYFGFGIIIFFFSVFPILFFVHNFITTKQNGLGFSTMLKLGNVFLALGYLGAALCTKEKISYSR